MSAVLSIAGTDISGVSIDATVSVGRDAHDQQPEASVLGVTINGWKPAGKLGDPVVLSDSAGRMFGGTVTDFDATLDGASGQWQTRLSAVGPLADLGRNYLGDEVWPQETDSQRIKRVLDLAAAPSQVNPNIGGPQILARDVDHKPAQEICEEVASSALGVLWEQPSDPTTPIRYQAQRARSWGPVAGQWSEVPPLSGGPEVMFSDSPPNNPNPPTDVTLGIQFTPLTMGVITHIRYYVPTATPHVFSLWTLTGKVLCASVTATPAVGWQEIALSTPYTVTAGVVYVASVYTMGTSYGYRSSPPASLSPNLGGSLIPCSAFGNTFPVYTDTPTYYYCVDVVYRTAGAMTWGTVTPAGIRWQDWYTDQVALPGEPGELTVNAGSVLAEVTFGQRIANLVRTVRVVYGPTPAEGERTEVVTGTGIPEIKWETVLADAGGATTVADSILRSRREPTWLLQEITMPLHLLAPAVVTAIRSALAVGLRLTIEDINFDAPSGPTWQGYVEGWQHEIGGDYHRLILHTSDRKLTEPADRWQDVVIGELWNTLAPALNWESAVKVA